MATTYVLDTNVVSELMRPNADAKVLKCLSALDDSAWCITSMTETELHHGLALLPAGRRKQRLDAAMQALLMQDFAGRILMFDSAASVYYAQSMAQRAKAGRPLQVQDAMIAACCMVHVATLVTRNTKGFEGLDLSLVNPWECGSLHRKTIRPELIFAPVPCVLDRLGAHLTTAILRPIHHQRMEAGSHRR